MTLDKDCTETSEDGTLNCKKSNFWSENSQEYIPHAGGHMFATDESMDKLMNWHIDATALLSGRPAESHPPEECTRTGFCAWRKDGDI